MRAHMTRLYILLYTVSFYINKHQVYSDAYFSIYNPSGIVDRTLCIKILADLAMNLLI